MQTNAPAVPRPKRLFALRVRGSFDCQYAFPVQKDAEATLDVLPRTVKADIVEIAPSDKPTCYVVLVEGQDSFWTFTTRADAFTEASGRHVSLDGKVRRASVLPCAPRAS